MLVLVKSKDLSDERINSIAISNYSITSKLSYYVKKIRVEFNGSCLKKDKITYTHGKTVNVCIVYEISKTFNINSYPTVENCLFDAVSLTKNNYIDKINIPDMVLDLTEKQNF